MQTARNGVADRNGTPHKNTTLRLTQARQDTPPVDPVEAVKRSLVMTLYGQVGDEDVVGLVESIKKAAAGGDKASQRMLLDLITKVSGAGKPQIVEKIVHVEAGARQLRLLAAYAIAANGPMLIETLAKLVGMSDSDTAALLDGCWFETTSNGIALSHQGKQQVG